MPDPQTLKPWEEMTERERDAAVAREVMGATVMHGLNPFDGWSDLFEVNPIPYDKRLVGPRCPEIWAQKTEDGWDLVPRYSTDPAADYEVLRHVRDTWGNDCSEGWSEEKWDAFRWKMFENMRRNRRISNRNIDHIADYEPGDYAWAALEALRSRPNA